LKRALDDVSFLLRYNPLHPGWRWARANLFIQYKNYEAAFLDIKDVMKVTSMDKNDFLWRTSYGRDKGIDIQNAGKYVVSKIYGLPERHQAVLKKAYCQIVIGQNEEALATLGTSHLSGSHPAFLYLKGLANELMGYWIDAQPFYNKALARDNDIVELHLKRGNFHANRQEWAEAEKDFDVVLKRQPDFMAAYRARGIAHYYNKKYAEAIVDLNHYLKVDSANLECIAYRGRCYQEMGRMFDAIRDLSDGREFGWIDFNRANKTIDSLIWAEDSVHLAQFISYFSVFLPFQLTNSSAEIFDLKMMIVDGRWQEIDDEWEEYGDSRLMQLDKRFASILCAFRGASLTEKGQYGEAARMFKEAIGHDKNNSYAYFERGKLHLRQKEFGLAKSDFSKAFTLGDTRAARFLGKVP
jgi:tetratricopeptide (TPR) repeat protein